MSLPPRALPRPARSLKPPRKVEYDRLSDSQLKAHSQTPPKIITPSSYDIRTSSLKRDDFPKCKFSSSSTYMEMKQALGFPKSPFSLKPRDYGSMNKNEFSKPDYTSKKNYSRLEGSPRAKTIMPETSGFKRSLLPTVRKYSQSIYPATKSSRESLNSSESNNSSNMNMRRSPNPNPNPNHAKGESSTSGSQQMSRMLSKQLGMTQQDHKNMLYHQQQQSKNNYVSASLPPKPADRTIKSSLSNENRYRIQF